MGTIAPIDHASAHALLTLLSTIDAPLTESNARQLAATQGWTIVAEAPGEAMITNGNWPNSDEVISFTFADGILVNMLITACVGLHDDPQAHMTALDTFSDLVHAADDVLGPRTGEILGERPRAWWDLPRQTIAISRWDAATTITWSSREEHDAVLRSIREDA